MRLSTIAVSFFLLILLLSGWACQRDNGKIGLRLDQPLKNAFEHHYLPFAAPALPLEPFETVAYFEGPQRVSARSADVDLGNIRFRIGMVDVDQDGTYCTPGIDLLVVSFYGVDSVVMMSDMPSISPFENKNFIQVDRHCFLVSDVDPLGQSLSLIPWDHCPSSRITARLRTSMGKVPLKTVAGEDTYLGGVPGSDHDRLVILWSVHADENGLLARLQHHRPSWASHLDVQVISMLDSREELESYLKDQPHTIPVYWATAATCDYLNCHTRLPFGILVDRMGRIIRPALDEKQILEYIAQSGQVVN